MKVKAVANTHTGLKGAGRLLPFPWTTGPGPLAGDRAEVSGLRRSQPGRAVRSHRPPGDPAAGCADVRNPPWQERGDHRKKSPPRSEREVEAGPVITLLPDKPTAVSPPGCSSSAVSDHSSCLQMVHGPRGARRAGSAEGTVPHSPVPAATQSSRTAPGRQGTPLTASCAGQPGVAGRPQSPGSATR